MRLLLVPMLAALAACGTTQSSIPYARTVSARTEPATAARPVVAVADRVANERRAGREDPTWIGTIRGGYGNPLKRLNSDVPVDEVVKRAFSDALAARGSRTGAPLPTCFP